MLINTSLLGMLKSVEKSGLHNEAVSQWHTTLVTQPLIHQTPLCGKRQPIIIDVYHHIPQRSREAR